MQFFEPMGYVGGKGPKDRPAPPKVGGGVPDKPQASKIEQVQQLASEAIARVESDANSGRAVVTALEYLRRIKEIAE